jgi:regulator of nonsense transcripts 3
MPPATKPSKNQSKKPPSENASPSKPKFKLIMRRLPDGLNRETLLNQIEPLDGCVDYWFRRANKTMDPWSFSRAYLVFDDWQKAVEFRNRFNGYVFIDTQGLNWARG